MPAKSDNGINSWLEDELYQQYLHDHSAVDESWKALFERTQHDGAGNVAQTPVAQATAPAQPAPTQAPGTDLLPLRGAAARIAENMAASASIPLATSQRTIPVKVMDENRRIINQHRSLTGKSKVSFTHLIGWGIVQALGSMRGLNDAFAQADGQPYRVVHNQINLGIAVDVAGKDGARNLLVPNIKDAGSMTFQQYLSA